MMPGCMGEGIVDAAGVLCPGPCEALRTGGRIIGGRATGGAGLDMDRGIGAAGEVRGWGGGRAAKTGDAG